MEDLLVLANADAMRYRWDPNELDTDALLIDTFEAFRTLARQRDFRLNMQLPEQPLPRVLEIVSGCVKFSPVCWIMPHPTHRLEPKFCSPERCAKK